MTEYGEDITKYANKRCLCLSNHLGLIDHFCLMTAFHNKKSLTGKVYIKIIFRKFFIKIIFSIYGLFLIFGNLQLLVLCG